MNRNTLALLWIGLWAALWTAVLQLLPQGLVHAQMLVLDPDPWWGMAAALVLTAIACVPAWRWIRGGAGVTRHDQGLAWRPVGVRAWARLWFSGGLSYALAMGAWFWWGPPTLVNLAPFLTHSDRVLDTCATVVSPADVRWAIEGMCLWSSQRVVPVAVGAGVVGLVALLAALRSYRQREVLSLEIDSVGLRVETGIDTQRIPWTSVARVDSSLAQVVLELHDGTVFEIPARGLPNSARRELVLEIDARRRSPVELTASERERMADLGQLGDA